MRPANESPEVTMHGTIDLRVGDLVTVDPVVVGPDASTTDRDGRATATAD
jgi:hypothetical protein